MRVGAASIVINNDLGTAIQGASTNQVVNSIRDNLEANAVFIEHEGGRLLLIGVDVVALNRTVIENAQQQIAARIGIAPQEAIISCTHTHAGPSVLHTSFHKVPDEAYQNRLCGWLADVAEQAAGNVADANWRFGWGEARIGFNRRLCWADGTHTMHGNAERDDFIGLEGEADPRHTSMLIENEDGEPVAVIHANSAHPTLFYGRDFLSADYPGEARRILRDALGELPVIYINGSFGDVAPHDMLRPHHRANSEVRVREMGSIIAATTLGLLRDSDLQREVRVGHAHATLETDIRIPGDDEVAEAKATLDRVRAGEEIKPFDLMYAHGKVQLHAEFAGNPHDVLHLHAIAIGPVAIFTHPVELFTYFGLNIKRRSPFAATIISDCTNGYSGYCPTFDACLGGGYSADTMYASRVVPSTGYRMVDQASRMLFDLSGEQAAGKSLSAATA